jgi:hypothetical protein
VWLEHSSAYQFLVIGALADFLAAHGPDPELTDLLAQMKTAAAWFVKPDGELTKFGDSNLDPAPDWAPAALRRPPPPGPGHVGSITVVRPFGLAATLPFGQCEPGGAVVEQ